MRLRDHDDAAAGMAMPSHERDGMAFVVPTLAAVLSAAFLWLVLFGGVGDRRPMTTVINPTLMIVLVVVTWRLLRLPQLGGGERRAWRALLTGFVLFLTSGALGVLAMLAPWLQLLGLRQIVIVGGFGAMVFALFRFPAAPQTRLPRARFVLDAATVFAATTMFLWHFAIAPRLRDGGMDGGVAVLLVAAFGFMAVVVVVLAMLLMRERTPGTRGALMRLVVGVGLVLGVSLIGVGRGLSQDAPELWAVALNWVAVVMVISAAIQQRRSVMVPIVIDREREPRAVFQLSYVAVVLSFGFMLLVGMRESPLELRGVLVGAAVVAGCVVVRQRLLLHENEALRAALEWQATQDPLTGLRNRRAWETEAEREIAKALRSGSPLAVAMFDLDRFKAVNDRYGHGVGDEVLRLVGDLLSGSLRTTDLPARLGGDEFVLLLPDTALDDAVRLAEALVGRLLRGSAAPGFPTTVSVSVGVAAMPPASSLRELVAMADAAMYAAKRGGGACVRAAEGGYARKPRPYLVSRQA